MTVGYRQLSIADAGMTGIPFLIHPKDQVVLSRFQFFISLAVQGIFIWYMLTYIAPCVNDVLSCFAEKKLLEKTDDDNRNAPWLLAMAAIYLNCIQSVQNYVLGVKAWNSISKTRSRSLFNQIKPNTAKFMVIIDSFLIPTLMAIIGGLWLCTSSAVNDLVLNATAVGFVNDIDNMIAQILDSSLGTSSKKTDDVRTEFTNGIDALTDILIEEGKDEIDISWNQIYFVDEDYNRIAQWMMLIMIPVAWIICWIGFENMGL